MKSLVRILEEMLTLWLLVVLAGTSCAVFYTPDNDNDFPRLGRRSGGIGSSVFPGLEHNNHDGVAVPLRGRMSGNIFTTAPANKNDNAAGRHAAGGGPAPRAEEDSALSVYDVAPFGSSPLHAKRGIFTNSGPGMPRIGRSQGKRSRSGGLLPPAAVMTSLGGRSEAEVEEEEEEEEQEARVDYMLGVMFLGLDKDGDKDLTMGEFVQGLAGERPEGTLYR